MIKNGTVIDHIDGGEALNVVKILGIIGTMQDYFQLFAGIAPTYRVVLSKNMAVWRHAVYPL